MQLVTAWLLDRLLQLARLHRRDGPAVDLEDAVAHADSRSVCGRAGEGEEHLTLTRRLPEDDADAAELSVRLAVELGDLLGPVEA